MGVHLSQSPLRTRWVLSPSNAWEGMLGSAAGRGERTSAQKHGSGQVPPVGRQPAKETISSFQEENEISARNYRFDTRVGEGFLNKTGKRAEHKKDDYI